MDGFVLMRFLIFMTMNPWVFPALSHTIKFA